MNHHWNYDSMGSTWFYFTFYFTFSAISVNSSVNHVSHLWESNPIVIQQFHVSFHVAAWEREIRAWNATFLEILPKLDFSHHFHVFTFFFTFSHEAWNLWFSSALSTNLAFVTSVLLLSRFSLTLMPWSVILDVKLGYLVTSALDIWIAISSRISSRASSRRVSYHQLS